MTDIDHAAILRQHADTRRRGHSVNPDVLRAAADEIERLRAERDEVRQSYCLLMEAYRGGDGRVTANKLGWGYLFEEPRLPKKEDGSVANTRRELCAARRELCRNEAIIRLQRHRVHRDSEDVVGLAKEIAVERGWDCFKENRP